MKERDITQFMKDNETPNTRAFSHILDVVFLVAQEMEDQGIDRKELASRMNISVRELDKMLDGDGKHKLTMFDVARMEMALGAEFSIVKKENDQ